MRIYFYNALFIVCLLLHACGGESESDQPSRVMVHLLSDPKMLNPYNTSDAAAEEVYYNLFQSLLGIDYRTLKLVPVLAKARPEIEIVSEDRVLLTYEIRPEAKWDNGASITAEDVAFSLKVVKNPKVSNHHMRPYYEFIDSIIYYEDNPRKFTLVSKEKYIRAEFQSGLLLILPAYVYDPDSLMSEFTVHELNREAKRLSDNKNINDFAIKFNSEKHQREKGFIVGSGPYAFEEWQTGQRVKLVRKEAWWGDTLEGEHTWFEAYPKQLRYEVVNDQTTALVALKGERLDVMSGITPKDFVKLPESARFNANYHTHTPVQLAYYYLGLNMRNPKFADRKVRQALAHMVDVEKIMDKVFYGLAERITGPFPKVRRDEYNEEVTPYPYDRNKAKKMLQEAGWKDTNGDGVIDKVLDGERMEFEIEYIYNAGNEQRKLIGLIFQEEARRIGINVTVIPQDWSVFLENLKNNDFDMYCGAWITVPAPTDPKQIWHTESFRGGSNYVGFGDAKTDALIEDIRRELNTEKRSELYYLLHEIIHREVPYIFLFSPKNRIAIHNRFKNADPSEMRPGYWVAGFQYQLPGAEVADDPL